MFFYVLGAEAQMTLLAENFFIGVVQITKALCVRKLVALLQLLGWQHGSGMESFSALVLYWA